MGSKTQLDQLPEEILAHIACSSQALDVLHLSVTNHKLRSACWNHRVLKSLLLSQPHDHWPDPPTLTAMTAAAGKTTSLWARFAVADQLAQTFASQEGPLDQAEQSLHWVPDLLTLQHPFLQHPRWTRLNRTPETSFPGHIFSQAMAILSSEHPMPVLAKTLAIQEDPILTGRSFDLRTHLWALCSIALTTRTAVRNREAAWPYNSAARVGHILPPTAKQALVHRYAHVRVPIPFALVEEETWHSWYQAYCLACFQDEGYFTEGTWCGYYAHFGMQARYQDPPMLGIKFRRVGEEEGEGKRQQEDDLPRLRFVAENAYDGIGTFSLTDVDVSVYEGDVVFHARKIYTNQWMTWRWELRVTPFGLVGFCCTNETVWRKMGLVWLWKEEWTQDL